MRKIASLGHFEVEKFRTILLYTNLRIIGHSADAPPQNYSREYSAVEERFVVVGGEAPPLFAPHL